MCMGLAAGHLYAQTKKITGKVTDEKGLPLSGASVLVKETGTGNITNKDGEFNITLNATAKTLVISFQGYSDQEVALSKKDNYNIKLALQDKNLDEVVVVGYQAMKKKEVTGAIARVSGKEIENLPVQTLDRAMQGRAAGVVVQANNGIPGGSVNVRIRGVGSITAGNVPLYIVDGVQMNTDEISTNLTQSNPLAFLNINDIESIEVLKDAAASAIYGAKAANGVVLITTKKGKGGKTQFTLNTYYGEASPLNYLNVLNSAQYYQLRYEAYINQNSTNPNYSPATAKTNALADLGLAATFPLDSIQYLPSYDWQRDAVYQKGTTRNVDISMSGGNEKTNFYLSASYNKQDAIVKSVNFSRGTLFSSVRHTVNSKVNIESSINLSTLYQNAPYSGAGGVTTAFGSPTYAASLMVPINPIFNPDGSYYGMPGSGQNFLGSFNQNVLATMELNTRWRRTNQLVGNLAVNYEIMRGLRYRGLVGIDYRQLQNFSYGDPRLPDNYNVGGNAFQESQWNVNFITTHTLSYLKNFKGHSINVLAGTEYTSNVNDGLSANAQVFPSYEFRTINSAAVPLAAGGFWTANKTFSLFGKINYDYQKKYLLTFTLRRDGSSRFGANNLFGTFPSVSAGWNMVNESFMKKQDLVSDLKLRLSYGQNGNNQIGNFDSKGLYGASTRVYSGSSALTPSQLANPDLKWEVREEWNAGLDFGFLKNRIVGSIDVYKRMNRDLLLNRPLYATTGFASVSQNLGSVQNKGIELSLRTINFDGEFKWRTSFNIAFQQNRVTGLYDTLQFLPSDASIRIGESLGSNFTTKYAGVNPATGRAMWYDINGNITYSPLAADRVIYGSSLPKQVGGLSNTFSYKGFTLDVFFNYEYGRVNTEGLYFRMIDLSRLSNTLADVFARRWQNPGDITDVPRPNNGAAEARGANFTGGSRSFFKQDYIRLKQVSLSYDLQPAVTKRLGLSAARFYVQGVNLWTYTDWPGYDPEFSGDSRGLVPQSKNITVGLTLGF